MVHDAAWLTAYDSYYYDQYGNRPLPVLRVRYDDPRRRGSIWSQAAGPC